MAGKMVHAANPPRRGPLDGVLGHGARTPEELETLFEDALVIHDREALAGLFEEGAVLVAGHEPPARGRAEIVRLALVLWAGDQAYVADPRQVVQTRDLALVVADGAINVMCRGDDTTWRYVISLLSLEASTTAEGERCRPLPPATRTSSGRAKSNPGSDRMVGASMRQADGDRRETMAESNYATAVSMHYTAEDLGAKILAGLRAAGKDTDALQVEDLAAIDQFHAGGAQATLALIRRASMPPGQRVLDVGGGLGGPARLIAHETGCTVTVLDLSEESCRVGAMLTARVGLGDRVTFRHGSALDIPFSDGEFDWVWTQHATMNIAEKERLYHELHRVLRPGGRLTMQEIMAGPLQPIHFPVPWAPDASISFLRPAAEIRALLEASGFREAEWIDERDVMLANLQPLAASQPRMESPALAVHLMLGPRLPEMQRNVGRNLREDRLTIVQAVFERP